MFSSTLKRSVATCGAVAGLLAAAAVPAGAAGPAGASLGPANGASPTTTTTVARTQGIIMRDGGVCDPIRHMGC
jgi:hypothetical protein